MKRRHTSAAAVLMSAAALLAATGGTASAAATHGSWRPCHLPSGYKHIVELHSAKNVKGGTVVRVTPEKCGVNPRNDEDVRYTATGAARSLAFAPKSSVKVYADLNTTDLKSVSPKWLVHHKLTNSPYFSYRVDSRGRVTAFQEIYHP